MTIYCVVCRDASSGHNEKPRTIRFYLGAASANHAIAAAAEEYPALRYRASQLRGRYPEQSERCLGFPPVSAS